MRRILRQTDSTHSDDSNLQKLILQISSCGYPINCSKALLRKVEFPCKSCVYKFSLEFSTRPTYRRAHSDLYSLYRVRSITTQIASSSEPAVSASLIRQSAAPCRIAFRTS